jgi:glycine cleavage system transcriptional repressor
MAKLILTAVGPDRPGLVAALSKLVHDAGASLADSRMVNLQGHFALLTQVEGTDAALDVVRAQLQQQRATLGMTLEVHSAAEPGAARPAQSVPYRLKTYSMDQPGIVARVTAVLSSHGVNLEELETRLESAPFAGTPLFTLEALISVPGGVSVRRLRDELTALGDAIGCDVDIDPA